MGEQFKHEPEEPEQKTDWSHVEKIMREKEEREAAPKPKTDWSHVEEILNRGKTKKQIEEEHKKAEELIKMPTSEDKEKISKKIEQHKKDAEIKNEEGRKRLIEKAEEEDKKRREEYKKKHGEYPPKK